MKELEIHEDDKLLIIAPHPDDECIGCGGILLAYPQKCTVWVLTDGGKGCPGENESSVALKREKEFLSEMSYLGITDFCMFHLEDGKLEIADRPYNEVDLCNFTKIFVPAEYDVHRDHRVAYRMIKESLSGNTTSTELYQYEISSALVNTTHFLDITTNIEKKEKLIEFHSSQIKEFDYIDLFKSINRYRAITLDRRIKYAEAYSLKNFRDDLAPISNTMNGERTKVYIYGKGTYYKALKKELNEQYEVIGFVDSFQKSDTYDGMPVYSVKDVASKKESVVICASYFFDMYSNLVKEGVCDERISFAPFLSQIKVGGEQVFESGARLFIYDNNIWIEDKEDSFLISSVETWNRIVLSKYKKKHPEIDMFSMLINKKPLSRNFGAERGRPIDRYYIEDFIKYNKDYIYGSVMEFGDNMYSARYGKDRIRKQYVAHVRGWGDNSIKLNLETGEGVEDGLVDCLICTQVLQYIYDLRKAFSNIYRLLKKNGVALITVPGIKSISLVDDENWGDRWSFTEKSLLELSKEFFCENNMMIKVYGNVKVAMGYLYGLCIEDFEESDFEYTDPQFPFLVCIRLRK